MTVIKRRIAQPTAHTYDDANLKYKQYITDINQIMIDAGFVRSNVSTNIDILAIPDFPVFTPTSSSGFYSIPGALMFDLDDIYQPDCTLRVSFTFSLYKYNNTSNYPYRQSISTTVGLVNPETNAFITGKYVTTYSPMFSQSSTGNIYYNDYGLNSYVHVSPGFVCVCISPGTNDSPTYDNLDYTNIFFVIERNFDNTYAYNSSGCNVIIGSTAPTSATSVLRTCVFSPTSDSIYTSANLLYISTSAFLSEGKLVTLPIMHVNSTSDIIQSPNLATTYSKAVGAGQDIDINVNNNVRMFYSIFPGVSTQISPGAAMLVASDVELGVEGPNVLM